MTIEEARGIAGRIWCDEEMKHRVMDPDIALKIADLLHEEYREDKAEVPPAP